MLSLVYENASGQSINFGNDAPYFFLYQQGMDGTDATPILFKSPFQVGKTGVGANIDERVVTVKCCLVSEDDEDYETRRREILRVLTPLVGGDIYVSGETFQKVFRDVQIVSAPVFDDKNYQGPSGITYFSFSFVVPGNFIEDLKWTENKLYEVVPMFSFELEFADEIEFGNLSLGLLTVDNDGDVPAPLIIKIPGPTLSPMVTNLDTGEFIKVNVPILANETMYINTGFGNKTVEIFDQDNVGRNAFNYIDLQSTFFNLKVGQNKIRFRAEEGNDTAAITIFYKKLYLGI